MLRKGGSGVIMVLVLALLGAGLYVATVVSGPLADAILEGHDKTEKNTDFTIEVHNEQTFSDLAMFVYQRASNDGCADGGGKDPTVYEQIQPGKYPMPPDLPLGQDDNRGWPQEGYPGLEDSYLGRYPECYEQSASIARGAGTLTQDPGKDQEGIFSREKFEIKKDILLKGDSPDSWIEYTMLAGSKLSPSQRIRATCADQGAQGYEYYGTHKNSEKYVFYFEENGDKRLMPPVETAPSHAIPPGNRFYCAKSGAINGPSIVEQEWREGSDPEFRVQLCEGDEGYIQMNKGGGPLHEGEAGESIGNDKAYPMIVITSTEDENCGAGGALLDYGMNKEGVQLYVRSDNDNGADNMGRATWPRVDQLELLDRSEDGGAEITHGTLNDGNDDPWEAQSDRCQVYFEETDVSTVEKGAAAYGVGMVLDYDGGFSSSYYASSPRGGKKFPDNTWFGGATAEWLYDNAEFDDATVGGDHGKLNRKYPGPVYTGEMYGDLLCANPGGDPEARWYMCEPGDGSTIAGDSITVGGTNYNCDPSTGDWNSVPAYGYGP